MKKRIILIGFILIFVFGMTACKRNGEKDNVKAEQSKDYVYRMEEIALPESESVQNISQVIRIKDSIYAFGYDWSDEGDNYKIIFFEIMEDGTLGEQHLIEVEQETSYNSFAPAADGNLYCVKNKYYVSEENTEEYIDEYYLVKITLDGEELFSTKLNDIPQLQELYEENGYFNVYNLIAVDDSVYVSCMGAYCRFDSNGNFVSITKGQDGQNSLDLDGASLLPISDGRVIATIYGETEMSLALVDMETFTIKEEYQLPGLSYNYSFYEGIGYDLYLTDSYGVYGYNLGDEAITKLMSFIDSDFAFSWIGNILPISEKEFYATYDDMETGKSVIAKFIKVDPSEVKEKQIITLAMAYSDWTVRMQVIEFNKINETYRIDLQDYSALYSTIEDYSAGISRLNTDIASGKVPDIILLDSSMPIDSYISKGLLEDLKPYIEKDSELDINNFMPNVIEAYSVDGKLYSLVPFYHIQTLLAKSTDVGTTRGWSVKQACELWDSKPEGTEFLTGVDRENMLRNCMNMAGSQFIDWESGKCSFDSDDFIQMLEFINRFPEELGDDYFTDSYWENYDTMLRDGKALTSIQYLSDIRSFNIAEKGNFGEDITMIGFPAGDGDGSAIMPGLQLAMSAKSAKKEGAWEFLRSFLVDEYQEDIYGFPISIKRLEEMKVEATQKPYYTDEDGNRIEYDDTWYVNGVEINIDPMTEQEAEEFVKELFTFTQPYKTDESLFGIIQEEASAYFAGQKSARDVASIIQSRAQLYVNENR